MAAAVTTRARSKTTVTTGAGAVANGVRIDINNDVRVAAVTNKPQITAIATTVARVAAVAAAVATVATAVTTRAVIKEAAAVITGAVVEAAAVFIGAGVEAAVVITGAVIISAAAAATTIKTRATTCLRLRRRALEYEWARMAETRAGIRQRKAVSKPWRL
jgi:cytochrome bd-type quinol oxidase subunit 2